MELITNTYPDCSPGHAGSNLSIAVDVCIVPTLFVLSLTSLQVSGNGKLTPDATNPNSTLSTHFSLLEIYLVSSETNTNLTVSSGPGLLAQEPSSTVKHVNWVVPTCIAVGNYNVRYKVYQRSRRSAHPFLPLPS